GRCQADNRAENDRTEDEGEALSSGDGWRGKERSGSQEMDTQNGRGGAGDGDGNKAARPPLEEEQLDGKQDGGNGSGEGRRHSRGCAGDEQGGALGIGEVEPLGNERTDGSAGHNDGAFGTEG